MISDAEFATLCHRFPVFAGLTDTERRDFVVAASSARLGDGAQAFARGAACESFLWLVDGCVRVCTDDGRGREILLYRVRPGELCVFTTSCALGHEAYPAEGLAEGETRAVVLPVRRFEDLIVRAPVLRRQVFAALSTRLHEVMALVEDLAFRHLEQRVVAWLLRRTLEVGGPLDCSHQQLADDLGCAREPVSRVLASLDREGVLRLGRRRIEVLQPDVLAARARS